MIQKELFLSDRAVTAVYLVEEEVHLHHLSLLLPTSLEYKIVNKKLMEETNSQGYTCLAMQCEKNPRNYHVHILGFNL